ncbi:two-component sensor histidine kinase, partial [Promicromonospora citrea]|nr:two-component sensor histidine kinase [Promicromonospora citrea]
RHGGPGPVTLAVRHDADAVHVEAANPVAGRRGRRASGGRGLAGIRERAALFGGTVSAGPDDGRWALRVTLPAVLPKEEPRA